MAEHDPQLEQYIDAIKEVMPSTEQAGPISSSDKIRTDTLQPIPELLETKIQAVLDDQKLTDKQKALVFMFVLYSPEVRTILPEIRTQMRALIDELAPLEAVTVPESLRHISSVLNSFQNELKDFFGLLPDSSNSSDLFNQTRHECLIDLEEVSQPVREIILLCADFIIADTLRTLKKRYRELTRKNGRVGKSLLFQAEIEKENSANNTSGELTITFRKIYSSPNRESV